VFKFSSVIHPLFIFLQQPPPGKMLASRINFSGRQL